MARQRTKFIKGVVLVELLVAFGLASILLPALLTGFVGATQGREVYEQRIAAAALVREAEEAIRSFRNEAWSNVASLAPGTNYYPSVSGPKWTLSTGSETINDFTRTIVVSDVYRDPTQNQKIVTQGSPNATLDPSTRQFLITVSWSGFFTRSITSSLYITRYGNTSLSETQTVSAPGGGFGDWCKPVGPLVTDVNLDRKGHPTTIRAFESLDGTGNRILAGTGASADGPGFTNINIIGNSPPAATPLGDYDGTPQIKVNGLVGDTHYVFLATDAQGVVILDLSVTPYQPIGSFSPKNMKNVNDVYVVGDTGYAVTTDKFYIFSISSNRKTTTQIGNTPLSLANGAKVVVDASNQYAYVPNPDSAGELKIIDVHSHPGSLTGSDVKNVNVDGGAGRDVFINAGANRAYLATVASLTQPEFFIIDIKDKGNPTVMPQGTYDTDGMDPQGVTIVSGERAIMVGTGGHEYQVFSIEGDKVSFCQNHATGDDFLNIDTGVFAVSSVLQKTDQHAYSYIATGDSIAEIKIIEGGSGTGGVGGNGTYESPTLPVPDPGHDVAFNSFTATSDPNLSYKISIKHGVGGSCLPVTYSDSDFTAFVPGTLPLTTIGNGYVNPGECLRFRAINSGSSLVTFTAKFNYSP
jgi:type II secretory pathway pseudopilin PulG